MKVNLTSATVALIASGAASYASGSLAKLDAVSSLVIAIRGETLAALSIPAAQRPKVTDIQAAIRAEYGGADKEGDRGRYESCSMAIRVLAKLDKENEATLSQAMKETPQWLTGQIAALAGRATEDAVRGWLAGEKKEKAETSPGQKVMAYLAKNGPDLKDADLAALSDWLVEEMVKRERIKAEIAAMNAEPDAEPEAVAA